MKIRGTFLKDYVKLVNDTPELDWKRYLTDADWEVVAQTIIPTEWYPVETMGRIGLGIFEMRVNKDYSLVRLHGRSRANDSYDEATKKFLLKDDPVASIKSFISIAARIIDTIEVTLVDEGPGHASVRFYPVDGAPSWDLFREIQCGTMEALVEMNGGKSARGEFVDEMVEGREACVMKLGWEEED